MHIGRIAMSTILAQRRATPAPCLEQRRTRWQADYRAELNGQENIWQFMRQN
jgi:hypothetical protein